MLRFGSEIACSLLALSVVVSTHTRLLAAEECHLEQVDGLPMELAPAIAKELAKSHVKLRLGGEDYCEVWLAKAWKTRAADKKAEGSASILYPVEPGSLVGVIRLPRTCYDLRDQEIPAGLYTLRYAVQPDIEAHKDSHESRDFLLLVACSADKSPDVIADQDKAIGLSSDSIQSLHPAFLPLVKPAKTEGAQSVRRDPRDPDGWILRLHGKDSAGQTLPMEAILLHVKLGG